MTRRTFCHAASIATALAGDSPAAVTVPILHVVDTHATWRPGQIRRFTNQIWPEAVRDFQRCGVLLKSVERTGEILRYPTGRPLFKGLKRGALNMIITGYMPLAWDNGRALSGLAARYEGFDVCLIALDQAHTHQIPYLSVNTCIHELLHVLLADTREQRPKGWRGDLRETRIDWYATQLWLFGQGSLIRDAAKAWLARQPKSVDSE